MKLSILATVVAMMALVSSSVQSTHLHRRQDAKQLIIQRPITPANSLFRYIQEAEMGVKLFNDSLKESLRAGQPNEKSILLSRQATFVLTAALGDAAYALKGGKISTEEAQSVGSQLKNLADHVKPIAAKVGTLKPFYDRFRSTTSKEAAVDLQYLAGAFDKFYQALKGELYANAKQTVAGYLLEVICAIDAASTKLDSCSPLTDEEFCKKGNSDWDSLPRQCPGLNKCSSDDIRKAVYATKMTNCYDESCRGDDWCKGADKEDMCKWTPAQWK